MATYSNNPVQNELINRLMRDITMDDVCDLANIIVALQETAVILRAEFIKQSAKLLEAEITEAVHKATKCIPNN